jgi:hypothetical protein
VEQELRQRALLASTKAGARIDLGRLANLACKPSNVASGKQGRPSNVASGKQGRASNVASGKQGRASSGQQMCFAVPVMLTVHSAPASAVMWFPRGACRGSGKLQLPFTICQYK